MDGVRVCIPSSTVSYVVMSMLGYECPADEIYRISQGEVTRSQALRGVMDAERGKEPLLEGRVSHFPCIALAWLVSKHRWLCM